jgi:hypothetical protein
MKAAIPLYSLNYDYIPTILYGSQCLWADTKFPVSNLKIGTKIKFVSVDTNLVMPTEADITVSDIIGTRIVFKCQHQTDSLRALTFFEQKKDISKTQWHPLNHGPHWGYSTRDLASNPAADRNWVYGNGDPLLYMVW